MGPGRFVADPFLAFVERVFFADSRPALNEGVFVATWALDFAVGLGAGVVSESPRIAVLAREAPDMPLVARSLSVVELSDALASVRAAEKHLAAYRRGLPDAPQ